MRVLAVVLKSVAIGASFAAALWTSSGMAKECYAPDARAQERAFSRAVVTEGGKTVWLGGQTGSPESNFEGQAREIMKRGCDGFIQKPFSLSELIERVESILERK